MSRLTFLFLNIRGFVTWLEMRLNRDFFEVESRHHDLGLVLSRSLMLIDMLEAEPMSCLLTTRLEFHSIFHMRHTLERLARELLRSMPHSM